MRLYEDYMKKNSKKRYIDTKKYNNSYMRN